MEVIFLNQDMVRLIGVGPDPFGFHFLENRQFPSVLAYHLFRAPHNFLILLLFVMSDFHRVRITTVSYSDPQTRTEVSNS